MKAKAQFIFSTLVFLSAAFFCSDNFATPKGSEGASGLCKMYVNKIEDKNLTGHAFITAKSPGETSNDQHIITAAHLAFDKNELKKRFNERNSNVHIQQVDKLFADCDGVKLELKLNDSISRVGVPGFSYYRKCQKPNDFFRERLVVS